MVPGVVGASLVGGDIELQVEETVIGGVQNAEPVSLGLHLQVWVGGAVDDRGVQEALARYGGVRNPRPQRRLPGCSATGSGDGHNRLIVLVRNGSNLDASHGAPIDALGTGGLNQGP